MTAPDDPAEYDAGDLEESGPPWARMVCRGPVDARHRDVIVGRFVRDGDGGTWRLMPHPRARVAAWQDEHGTWNLTCPRCTRRPKRRTTEKLGAWLDSATTRGSGDVDLAALRA